MMMELGIKMAFLFLVVAFWFWAVVGVVVASPWTLAISVPFGIAFTTILLGVVFDD